MSFESSPPLLNINLTTQDDSEVSCRYVGYNNRTISLNVKFGYIPETLLINLIIWVILLLLFAFFRKKAWNYGRIALVQKNDTKQKSRRRRACSEDRGEPAQDSTDKNGWLSKHSSLPRNTVATNIDDDIQLAANKNTTVVGSTKSLQESNVGVVGQDPVGLQTDGNVVVGGGVDSSVDTRPLHHGDGRGRNSANRSTLSVGSGKSFKRWTQLFYCEIDSPADGLLRHQDSSESVDTYHADRGFCSWLTAIFKIKDEHISKKCGHDAVQYLTFQRYMIIYLGILCIICLAVVLPVNFQGTLAEGDSTSFGHTTMSNLEPESSLLWIHVILGFLLLPLGVFLMRHFSVNLKYEGQEYDSVSRTLMITHVPKNKCHKDLILRHFREAYPDVIVDDVQFAYDIAELMDVDSKRDSNREARVWCEDFFKESGEKLKMKTLPCSGMCGCCCRCCGTEVDAIEYYKEREEKFAKQVEDRKSVALNNPLGIAFVTFQSKEMARTVYLDNQTSCRCGHDPSTSNLSRELEALAWGVYNAPPPEDIYWGHLSSDTDNWYIRAALINFGLFLVLFFLTTPAIFVNSLTILHFQEKIQALPMYISEFAPTILIWSAGIMLPVIVGYSEQFLYHWTRSAENHSKMRKVFIFLMFMVVILPSLGLTSAKAFVEWAVKPSNETEYRWKCVFLPDNGAFFVNYVIFSAFAGTALELIRFPELCLYVAKMLVAKSPAEQAMVRKDIMWEFQFGIQYAWMLLHVGVTIIYSLPCPIIAPFGLVYIFMKHCIDRHNIFFVYAPSKINKRVHVTAINFVITTIIMLQIVILFFVFIRSGGAARGVSSLGPLVWVALTGCCFSIFFFVGQISFKVFKGIGAISYKGATRSRPQIVEDRPATTVLVKYIPPVLRGSEPGANSASAIPKRSYGANDQCVPGDSRQGTPQHQQEQQQSLREVITVNDDQKNK